MLLHSHPHNRSENWVCKPLRSGRTLVPSMVFSLFSSGCLRFSLRTTPFLSFLSCLWLEAQAQNFVEGKVGPALGQRRGIELNRIERNTNVSPEFQCPIRVIRGATEWVVEKALYGQMVRMEWDVHDWDTCMARRKWEHITGKSNPLCPEII